jgi:hypothetical protein
MISINLQYYNINERCKILILLCKYIYTHIDKSNIMIEDHKIKLNSKKMINFFIEKF